jgi:hypothetical protein
LLSDVPPDQVEDNFSPGADEVFEEIVDEERKEEDEKKDDDSLTVCEAGQDWEKVEVPEQPEQATMPAKKKFPAVASAPHKQPGQCNVSWAVLNPTIAYADVEDPEVRRRRGFLSRKGMIIRVDIPSGVVPSSFVPELSPDGRTIVFDCYMERSRYNPQYTMDSNLAGAPGVIVAMQKTLQDNWTHVA